MVNVKTIKFLNKYLVINKFDNYGFSFGIHKELVYIQLFKYMLKIEQVIIFIVPNGLGMESNFMDFKN